MLHRREVLVLGGAAAVALMCPAGASAGAGGVTLGLPDVVDNPESVPVRISAEGAAEVTLTAEGGIAPEVITFTLGPLAVARDLTAYVRVAGVRRLTAVARMPDGSSRHATCAIRLADAPRAGVV